MRHCWAAVRTFLALWLLSYAVLAAVASGYYGFRFVLEDDWTLMVPWMVMKFSAVFAAFTGRLLAGDLEK